VTGSGDSVVRNWGSLSIQARARASQGKPSMDARTDPHSEMCRNTTIFSEQLGDVFSPTLARFGLIDEWR
jgi:hypothetical protein